MNAPIQKTEVKVVTAHNEQSFEEAVNRYLADGWHIKGDIQVTYYKDHSNDNFEVLLNPEGNIYYSILLIKSIAIA